MGRTRPLAPSLAAFFGSLAFHDSTDPVLFSTGSEEGGDPASLDALWSGRQTDARAVPTTCLHSVVGGGSFVFGLTCSPVSASPSLCSVRCSCLFVAFVVYARSGEVVSISLCDVWPDEHFRGKTAI